MATESQKYRANLLFASGFAIMTPFGKLILSLLGTEPIVFNVHFLMVSLISTTLLYFGIIIVLRGDYILDEK